MHYHPNAKTTIALRKAIRECPLPAGKAAEKFNVHINTIYKWRKRKEEDLFDRSHRTGIKSYTLNEAERYIICEVKKLTLFSVEDLLQVLKPFIPKATKKTIYTTLKQEGLNNNKYILPKDEKKRAVKKFKDYKEGYLHIDIKYLPKIEGKRQYLFASIDRKTRLVFIAVYDKKDKASSVDFLNKVIEFYPFKINKILTDNGKEFTDRFIKKNRQASGNHAFDKVCDAYGIEHRLIKPYTPQTNGMIERFNRKVQENVLDIYKFKSHKELKEALNKYVYHYNFYIKQKALEYNSPVSFIQNKIPNIYDAFIERHNQMGLYNKQMK